MQFWLFGDGIVNLFLDAARPENQALAISFLAIAAFFELADAIQVTARRATLLVRRFQVRSRCLLMINLAIEGISPVKEAPEVPKDYWEELQRIAERRITLAGYRLADLIISAAERIETQMRYTRVP